MKINFSNKKIWIIAIPIVLVILILAIFQGKIFKVSAQVVPITVNIENLDFGTVFPGEQLQGNFIVTYVDEGNGIKYQLIQKRKPLPSEHPDYPNGGDPQMPGYYKNLCPYLEKTNNEGEGDTETDAFVGPNDPTDTWIIYFKVPAIFGNVSQDHVGGVIDSSGEYGCDVSIDITEPFIIDTIIVPSNGSIVSSNIVLENGKQYMIEASGTYTYWPAQLPNAGIADAEYSLRPQGSYNPGPGPQWISGDALPSPYQYYLEVKMNGADVSWGVLNLPDHKYNINYAGTGSTATFQIIDNNYSDNSGSIIVKIYQLP